MSERCSHLIIVGAPKSGTTSLHEFLALHSDVRVSKLKELHFFDRSWPEDPTERHSRYEACFSPNPPGGVCVEATPDYMNDSEVPTRIAATCPRPVVVMVCREPLARLVSIFRHLRRLNRLPANIDFKLFLGEQDSAGIGRDWRSVWRDGLYGSALVRFADAVGVESVEVVFSSELSNQPAMVVRRLALRAGIDPEVVDGFDFAPRNVGWDTHWAWWNVFVTRVARRARELTRDRPRLRAIARGLKRRRARRVEYAASAESWSAALPRWLAERYREDAAVLKCVAGREVPWIDTEPRQCSR